MHNATNGFELLYLKWLKILWWNTFAQKILLKREVVLIKLLGSRTYRETFACSVTVHSMGVAALIWAAGAVRDCWMWAWVTVSQLHVPGSWVFWGRFLSSCSTETVSLFRGEIFISPEKAGFKSLFSWSSHIYGVQRSSSNKGGGMPSSRLAGDPLRSQPGLEVSHPVPVDSPYPLGYTCISIQKGFERPWFYSKMGCFKVAKISVGWEPISYPILVSAEQPQQWNTGFIVQCVHMHAVANGIGQLNSNSIGFQISSKLGALPRRLAGNLWKYMSLSFLSNCIRYYLLNDYVSTEQAKLLTCPN